MTRTIRRLQRRAQENREDGFTLAELIVYSILMIVVLGLAAMAFIRLVYAQRDIKAMNDANNDAQLLFEKLEWDVRNADWAIIKENGNLLVMRTRVATSPTASQVYCVGYYYDSTADAVHRVQTTTSSTTANALAATGAPLKAIGSAWPLALADADYVSGSRMFGPRDQAYDDPEAIDFSVRANTINDRKPIEFTKSISLRPQSNLGLGCK